MKKHLLRQIASAGIAAVMAASALVTTVSADEPYDVYNYNYLGEAVPSQAVIWQSVPFPVWIWAPLL